MTLAQLKQEALELDPAKRIRLVQDIWDSLVRESDSVQIPKRHKQVIDDRVAEHEANPRSSISLGQAKAQIRKHLSSRRKK